MEELHKQVRRAQWRLAMQKFVSAIGWCWFAAAVVALALIVVGKYWPMGVPDWAWGVGAVAAGLVVAIVWTFAARQRAIGAAIELDRRFALKERVSSTLALTPEQRETAAGQALIADAQRRIERIDVNEHFGVAVPRHFLLPLLPGLAALLVALFVPPAALENPAEAKPEDPKVQRQIAKSTEDLKRRLAEKREAAEKQQLPEAEALLKMLEKKAEEFEGKKADRKEAMAQLKDLSRELEARRQKVDAAEEVKKQLEQLKGIERGPAEKLADAMKKGNLPQAMKELEKLKEQINKAEMGEADKEKLAQQLEQMQKALERMAEARDAAQADLQKRIDQMKQAGQDGEAAKLQQQLEKMLQQMPQMGELDKLAQQMGECARCMRDGDMQNAEQALQQMQAGMQQLQQQLEEMELLDDAIQQLADLRDGLQPCDACGGKGCAKCGGKGFGQGEGEGDGEGDGLGRGRGQGARPEKETDTSPYDSQVRQKIGEGAADVMGMVDGPGLRNRTEQQIQADVEAVKEGTTDPLTGRRLPRKHREHSQEYFDSLREGR